MDAAGNRHRKPLGGGEGVEVGVKKQGVNSTHTLAQRGRMHKRDEHTHLSHLATASSECPASSSFCFNTADDVMLMRKSKFRCTRTPKAVVTRRKEFAGRFCGC